MKTNKTTESRVIQDFTRALDPASLFFDLGMEPDGWQRELLSDEIDRGIVCCCRQSGKSSSAATLGIHCALYNPGSLTLLVSPSQRQSAELFRKCKDFHRKLADAGAVETMTEESVLRAEFSNGSRIVSLPASESTVRGYSGPALVIIDEAARVSDELYSAITPMLAVSNGRLLMKKGHVLESLVRGRRAVAPILPARIQVPAHLTGIPGGAAPRAWRVFVCARVQL
jgi:hypothetical protein